MVEPKTKEQKIKEEQLKQEVLTELSELETETGWTKEAELLNGRVAMLSFVIIVLTELITGVGPVNQILSLFNTHL